MEKDYIKINVPRFKNSNGFFTTSKHSNLMKRIRCKDTEPELHFRKALWNAGIKYRLSNKNIPGKPDIIIKKFKLLIFIDGDFWHGFNWEEKKARLKSNRDYWIPKIERNIQRDIEMNRLLKERNWIVLRFWEHQIRKEMDYCIKTVFDTINNYFPTLPQESPRTASAPLVTNKEGV